MKQSLSILFLLSIYSCSTTENAHVMNNMELLDKSSITKLKDIRLNQGRPIYMTAHAYPQVMEGGDIWMGGTVKILVGREELSLESLIK